MAIGFEQWNADGEGYRIRDEPSSILRMIKVLPFFFGVIAPTSNEDFFLALSERKFRIN